MKPSIWIISRCLAVLVTVNSVVARETPESPYGKLTDEIYQTLSRINPEKNVVYSPLAVGLALQMVYLGASGETRAEIERFASNSKPSDSDVGNLRTALDKSMWDQDNGDVSLIGLFHQQDITIKPRYLTELNSMWFAKHVVEKCNFHGDPEACRRRINEWVAKNTVQKIPALLKDGAVNSGTVAVLASALHFKAPWANSFPSDKIKSLPFYRFGRENDQQNVPFLQDTRECEYSVSGKSVSVGIPFQGGEMVFCIVLPKTRNGITEFEGVKRCFDLINAKRESVALKIPKFKIKQNIDLKEVLQSLGLKTMFTSAANFERMTDGNITISGSIHEAFIDVHENGTDIAVGTGTGADTKSAQFSLPKEFVADHPFFYAIITKWMRLIIVAGKVQYIE